VGRALGLAAIAALLALAMMIQQPYVYGQEGRAIVVAVSHPFLYSLAEILGGTYVEAINIIPPGVDPHEYEPPVDVIKRIGEADLVLIDTLHHIPVSDRIYRVYGEKSLVLLEELEKRGWEPDKVPGYGVENFHEFLLDEKGIYIAIDVVGNALIGVAGEKGLEGAELYIKANMETAKKIFSEAFTLARTALSTQGSSSVALYSPVSYYIIRSIGVNITVVLTPDPEVEPSPQSILSLRDAGIKCLVASSDLEHIDLERLKSSLDPIGVEVIDLKVLTNGDPWQLPFLPILIAGSIKECLQAGGARPQSPGSEGSNVYNQLAGVSIGLAAGLAVGILAGSMHQRRRG